ncbi:MAG: DUF1203 domain-containing protein [Bacteroidota bacterium]
MNFQVTAIDRKAFEHLFAKSEKELEALGAKKMSVDAYPGFPCRVSLEDVPIGEEVILLSHPFHEVSSPYRASGPIFVWINATTAQLPLNKLPEMLFKREQSLRAYNAKGMMLSGVTATTGDLEEKLQSLLSMEGVRYVDAHNAKPGCFNCRIFLV